MNNKTKNIDPGERDLIINAAYGGLSFREKLKVKKLMRTKPELQELYKEYKSTADSVHTLQKERMPDSIIQKVENLTEVKLNKTENSFFNDLVTIFYSKPQLAFVASAIIAALLIFSIFTKQDFSSGYNTHNYTKTEIETANQQAKQTLMLVSQILSSTKDVVTEDIIPNKVVTPLNKSFQYVNDLFKKGDI